jgi:hypothetical protein
VYANGLITMNEPEPFLIPFKKGSGGFSPNEEEQKYQTFLHTQYQTFSAPPQAPPGVPFKPFHAKGNCMRDRNFQKPKKRGIVNRIS